MESWVMLKCQHVGGIVQTQSFTERQRERGGEEKRKTAREGEKREKMR